MARLVTGGFEAQETVGVTSPGNIDGFETSFTGTSTLEATVIRSGLWSLKCDSTVSDVRAWMNLPLHGVLGRTYFVRVYMRFAQFPLGTTRVLRLIGASSAQLGSVTITPGGAVQLFNDITASQIGSDGPTLSLNTWYQIEMSFLTNTGSVDTLGARVDGVSVASATGLALSESAPVEVLAGWTEFAGASKVVYLDDYAVNDSTGSAQTSWPGDGKVVLLLPTADSAVGTGWTLGTGTAPGGNAHGSVDNAPPVGVADLAVGSDPKQIRNATANANSAYDATMTTYTAAGVPTGAFVNVVDPIVATAAPVTTSSKQGTVGMVSNPAITAVALGAGGSAGAFWSGVAANTYPTGWKVSHGTVTYAPAVTLGTAPVMRINQVTSSTRIAIVCFMGIYVDYTPLPLLPSLVTARSRPS